MKIHQSVLFISTLSTILEICNCQLKNAMDILRDAGHLNFALTIKYDPIVGSSANITLQLKTIHEQNYIKTLGLGHHVFDSLAEVTSALYKKSDSDKKVKDISRHMFLIDELYEKFDNFVASIDTNTNITVLDSFFQGIVNRSDSIENALKQINILITENKFDDSFDMFQLMKEHIHESQNRTCRSKKLTQGDVWNFYNIVFDTEYKGSFLLVNAYRHLTMRKIANFDRNIRETQEDTKKRLMTYSGKTYGVMKNATKEILTCDDGKYIKNKTYIELQGITQGFIIDPNAISNAHDCNVNEPRIDFCNRNSEICFHRQCSELGGEVSQCRDLTEGKNPRKLSICPSEDSEKRYSWVELDGTSFGNNSSKKSCSKPLTNYGMVGTESHGFSIFSWSNEVEKKMCFCNCERPKWKRGDVRGISLLWNEADYINNRVITEIKFENKAGMIQLAVKQGRILPRGRIDHFSLSWIKTPDLIPVNINDNEAPFYSFHDEKKKVNVWVPGFDFEYISKNLSVNLDDLIAPKGHVVIGVGFQKTHTTVPYLNGIQLLIATVYYNFSDGTLGDEVTFKSKDKPERGFLNLGSPGSPVNMKKLNNDISPTDRAVQFQQTDWKKNLGQSIVPFFDIRPVNGKIAFPLSGIGLYHRGCKDCGGFLAWRHITYDFYKKFADNFRNDLHHYDKERLTEFESEFN